MLAKERLQYIIKRCNEDKSISIQTLSKEMNVSLSTVQRDLRKLNDNNEIIRDRGGILAKDNIVTSFNEEDTDSKLLINAKAKEALCLKASKVLKENEIIYLDAGSTISYLIPYLMNINLTIVTNSHYLINKLRGCKATIYLIGGIYDYKYDISKGFTTIEEIERFNFDKVFISANALDLKNNKVSTIDSEQGIIKSKVINNSKESYLLIDSSKLEKKSMYSFAKVEDFDEIFCDKKI